MDRTDRPRNIVRAEARAPVFISDMAAVTFAPARDEDGDGVVIVTWHQGEERIEWTEQMQLTPLDVEQLRAFCEAWLLVHGPPPSEAA